MKTSTAFNYTKYIYFLHVILFTSIFLVNESNARPTVINAEFLQENDSIKIEKYLIKITNSSGNGYGYDIYVEKKLFIHQATIPAIPGSGGFDTKAAAEKVARKVVEKMQKGESLPTITIEEMKGLDARPDKNTNHPKSN